MLPTLYQEADFFFVLFILLFFLDAGCFLFCFKPCFFSFAGFLFSAPDQALLILCCQDNGGAGDLVDVVDQENYREQCDDDAADGHADNLTLDSWVPDITADPSENRVVFKMIAIRRTSVGPMPMLVISNVPVTWV